MAKQRHIGLIIFSACSLISARTAFFDPAADVPPPEESWRENGGKQIDRLGLIHDLRYYIYGIGLLGLFAFLEDYVGERLQKGKRTETLLPPATEGGDIHPRDNPKT